MIKYLCDGKKKCKKSANCFKNGGSCEHTADILHARNFVTMKMEKNSFVHVEKNEVKN